MEMDISLGMMQLIMLRTGKQDKIFGPIIGSETVAMMDVFKRQELATQHSFHDEARALNAITPAWNKDHHISIMADNLLRLCHLFQVAIPTFGRLLRFLPAAWTEIFARGLRVRFAPADLTGIPGVTSDALFTLRQFGFPALRARIFRVFGAAFGANFLCQGSALSATLNSFTKLHPRSIEE